MQRVGIHMVSIQDLNGMISVDQTGKFPIMSQRGHQLGMILYNYDTNGILATGVQSRKASNLINVYEVLYQRLRDAGIKLIIQQLDNEVSEAMIGCIKEKKMDYQLASPHNHCLNLAERIVQRDASLLVRATHNRV